ncbi:hypothetical protein JAAARDRAFT_195124 [Jaapia argillacea MUCL 33604]|uniref:Uncharacterized protein n=1 Tax=Jaapia argillacea MUCL 33604 TaxID=933084 RepID=A0A067PNZ7_9AGAM|nr:hypothetical protein JAAARDRAFT_195124 [Jaapia argillacea MUCL 33604]
MPLPLPETLVYFLAFQVRLLSHAEAMIQHYPDQFPIFDWYVWAKGVRALLAEHILLERAINLFSFDVPSNPFNWVDFSGQVDYAFTKYEVLNATRPRCEVCGYVEEEALYEVVPEDPVIGSSPLSFQPPLSQMDPVYPPTLASYLKIWRRLITSAVEMLNDRPMKSLTASDLFNWATGAHGLLLERRIHEKGITLFTEIFPDFEPPEDTYNWATFARIIDKWFTESWRLEDIAQGRTPQNYVDSDNTVLEERFN